MKFFEKMEIDSLVIDNPSDDIIIDIPNEINWISHHHKHGSMINPRRIKIGSYLDVMDKYGIWYQARVINYDHWTKNVDIHFLSWSHYFNETISIFSVKIQSLYSHTDNWRCKIYIGMDLDVRNNSYFPCKWMQGHITDINNTVLTIHSYDSISSINICDIISDDIAKLGLHTWKISPKILRNTVHLIILLRSLILVNRGQCNSQMDQANHIRQPIQWLCSSAPYWVLVQVIPHLNEPRFFNYKNVNAEKLNKY